MPEHVEFELRPVPGDTYEARRWSEGDRRLRMLEGVWRDDLLRRRQDMVGAVRSDAWGDPSLSINVFRGIVQELAVLYDREPEISHDPPPGTDIEPFDTDGLANAIRLAGLWPMMQRVQRLCLGLREMLVRVHVDDRGRLRYRPVPPNSVIAASFLDDPSRPVMVQELRKRTHPDTGRPIWTIDYLDVSDPDAPIYRVHKADPGVKLGEDLSPLFLATADNPSGDFSGDAYPYRRRPIVNDAGEILDLGRPVLPFVLYHAEHSGDRLFDPFDWIELVEASLDLAVLQQMLIHSFKDASWPQRWIANLRPAGASVIDTPQDSRRMQVVSDPATILMLETPTDLEDNVGQPMVGQFQAGADVTKLEETLSNMIARVAQDAGVPPSDVQRLGGTARSGAAISLTNEGKRKAQRKYRSAFQAGDEQLVTLSAILLNRATGSRFPEGGYIVHHREIPLSPEELKARREHHLELYQAGLITRTRAIMEIFPGTTKREAEAGGDADTADAAEELAEALEMMQGDPESVDLDALREALADAMTALRGE